MRIAKKVIIGILATTMIFSAIPASVPSMLQIPTAVEAAEIEPRADVIYWVYRALSDGTIQKRRWNETRGYWVDPHWITVN